MSFSDGTAISRAQEIWRRSMINQGNLLETLAALEHEQWRTWSKTISVDERISEERLARWQRLWVDYDTLPEDVKEQDRGWARKVLERIRESSERIPRLISGDIVEVTWLDAGTSDRLRPEEIEGACGDLVTKSYGAVCVVTDHYLILLQNATVLVGDAVVGDGNSIFRIPIGTIEQVRVLEKVK